jgi:hypothetical protein
VALLLRGRFFGAIGRTLGAMATATMTLTDFLLARIAEDESHWHAKGEYARCCQECAALSDWEAGPTVDRMLAECVAKRAIVALHDSEHHCTTFSAPEDNDPCETLTALAAVYADHPDYRDEWRS